MREHETLRRACALPRRRGQLYQVRLGYQGLERSAEALANVSKLVGDTADGLDERLGQEYGDYARKAATAIEDTANKIASKNPDELIEDTRNFVRMTPVIPV